jgi:hypothetical protein
MVFLDLILIGMTAIAVLTLVTVLTSLWVLVPYVPTPPKVVKRMVHLAALQGNETVYDLGCGDGRILIEAKKKIPSITAIGIELPLGVWLLAKCRVFFSRLQIRIAMRDYRTVNLSDANVIFLYLFPEVMQSLVDKFNRELSPGTKVISHGFPFAGKTPIHEERVSLPSWHLLRPPKKQGPRVFVYEW